MKSKYKNLIILICSVLIIVFIIRISYSLESRSQKLPAVVQTNKVYISSLTSGVVQKDIVQLMKSVDTGDRIMSLQNNALANKLAALIIEKKRYLDLIDSSQNGDALKLELSKLDKEILDNQLESQKADLELQKIEQQLDNITPGMESISRKFKANQALYENGLISAQEFYEISSQYDNYLSEFYDLKYDSLYITQKLNTVNDIITLQKNQEELLKNNSSLLASNFLIDLEKINAKILEVRNEISYLSIDSPAKGIVTDINFLPGETVKAGDIIAEITDLSNVWISAYGNSFSRKNIKIGNYVQIYASDNVIIDAFVKSVSPVMEKVKALSDAYETANTYLKIDIQFDNPKLALQNLTPGERLFVRIFLNK